MGETSQMTSGTLSVFAYLRFGHAKGRDAVVGEPPEEHRYRKASKTGRRSGRKTPYLEKLHRGGEADLVSEPLRRQLQRHEHVIWKSFARVAFMQTQYRRSSTWRERPARCPPTTCGNLKASCA